MSVRTIFWPDERDAILDHIRQVYGPDDHQLWEGVYGQMPYSHPADSLVIDGDREGEIAGHALIVPRLLQIGSALLPTAEIALIGVLEAYRGRGYEQALLDAVHARMTARGDALGLSFGQPEVFEPWGYDYAVGLYLTSYESDISTELAQRAGRWSLAQSYERRTADRLGARNGAVTVRRFYTNDLPAVQALYTAESARGHYMLARDEATWTWQLDYLARLNRYEPDDFLVAEIDGRLVAYARVVSRTPVNVIRGSEAAGFSVIEAGGDHPDGIEALLGEIARTAQSFNAARIGLFVHPASALMRHALARGASLRQFTGAGFLRLHDLMATFNALYAVLETRRRDSRFANRAFVLVITTETDQIEVPLGEDEPQTVTLDIPAAVLARLITGWASVDHLDAGYHEADRDLLRVLFPPRDPKIGLADLI
jgi:ribosomal protein S18 acetylase RimI-like enzyme